VRVELTYKGFAVLYLRSSKALASTTCILPCPTFVRSCYRVSPDDFHLLGRFCDSISLSVGIRICLSSPGAPMRLRELFTSWNRRSSSGSSSLRYSAVICTRALAVVQFVITISPVPLDALQLTPEDKTLQTKNPSPEIRFRMAKFV
jgi:hypothetical protein